MPKRLRERNIFSSKQFTIKEIDLLLENGKEVTYEISDVGESVMVVPMVDEGTVLLINEYHAGIDEYQVGLCKGAIEKGQTPSEAAQKELQEEVGYKAGRLEELAVLTSSPGYSTHKTHIFLARDLQESRLQGDEEEELQVIPHSLATFEDLIDKGQLTEARMIAALYLARRVLSKRRG
ncbi:MAG: ADP compounds hydrolase NudE [bacterium]|nr:ADP compounds hydrolase NudE [bacterium]